jgi:hypothetical protein
LVANEMILLGERRRDQQHHDDVDFVDDNEENGDYAF